MNEMDTIKEEILNRANEMLNKDIAQLHKLFREHSDLLESSYVKIPGEETLHALSWIFGQDSRIRIIIKEKNQQRYIDMASAQFIQEAKQKSTDLDYFRSQVSKGLAQI